MLRPTYILRNQFRVLLFRRGNSERAAGQSASSEWGGLLCLSKPRSHFLSGISLSRLSPRSDRHLCARPPLLLLLFLKRQPSVASEAIRLSIAASPPRRTEKKSTIAACSSSFSPRAVLMAGEGRGYFPRKESSPSRLLLLSPRANGVEASLVFIIPSCPVAQNFLESYFLLFVLDDIE